MGLLPAYVVLIDFSKLLLQHFYFRLGNSILLEVCSFFLVVLALEAKQFGLQGLDFAVFDLDLVLE